MQWWKPWLSWRRNLLTNDPDAVGELLEVWDSVVDTSSMEGDFVDRYDGGGFM